MRTIVLLGFFCSASLSYAAIGKFSPDLVRTAEPRKSSAYLKHGLFVGGDRDITDVVVSGIRHSKGTDYERVVIDLVGNKQGDPVAIQRPPYYQIAVNPELRRLVVTLWGKMKLEFDPLKTSSIGQKSNVLKGLSLFPLLEQDRWSFEIKMKSEAPVEVFELSDPVRIIVDVRNAVAAKGRQAKSTPAKKVKINKNLNKQIKPVESAPEVRNPSGSMGGDDAILDDLTAPQPEHE